MKKYFMFLFLLTVSIQLFPQEQKAVTGNLLLDSRQIVFNEKANTLEFNNPQSGSKKSPFLAGLFSLVVPGAGEIYAGEYLKAAVFLALEGAVVTTALIYDKKGDDQTASFQKFADEHWNVYRYAKWTLDNLNTLNSSLSASDYSDVINPDNTVNWQRLNDLERAIGGGYSHSLPRYGEQQYYELIGKYEQYSRGWDDADLSNPDYYNDISPRFLYYAGERGKANDYYNVASKAVIGIYLNHVLSALDAVWSSISYNKNIAMQVRYEGRNVAYGVEYVPTLHLTWNF